MGTGKAHANKFFCTLKQEIGSHHVAVLERFIVTSSRAVKPHAPRPRRFCAFQMVLEMLKSECLCYEFAKLAMSQAQRAKPCSLVCVADLTQ